MIQDLLARQATDNATAVAYFYCQHDQTAKTEPLKILGIILYQIVSRIPAARIQQLEDSKISPTTIMGLEKLIKLACGDFSRTYVVIDALDECADEGAQLTVPRFTEKDAHLPLFSYSHNEPLDIPDG